ncbi:MAG: DUF2065 domain-containing protein [Salinisphaeraceae bacterium]|jgi:uncharacterized protein YjeT (DUF2065 family)|nr:DUF2065 domain-containing protein [Salinisphaeraceae bacterium]
MWDTLLRALALVMVIEGLMPLLAPDRWRLMLARVASVDSRSLRVFGAVLVGVGVLSLQLLRG